MNLKLETEFSTALILQEVDALKKQIDDMRPLPEDVEGRVMQKLRLDWNYNSNAIEGNQLSYGETVAFLMEGITAKGKPLKDHLDIRGHNQAINFLLSIVKETRPLSESDIRALHEMVLVEPYEVKAQTAEGTPTSKRISLGEYKTSPNHVQTATGETHYYATPEETPAKMRELMDWYSAVIDNTEIHPVVTAALFHHKFVAIHPFDDGNGRLSRILMNLILMQKGYPPVIVKMDDRKNYYSLLSRADNGDGWPFIEYVSEGLTNSLELFLKAAKGEDIEDEEDIDKELALYKLELQAKIIPKEKVSEADKKAVLLKVISPLVEKIYNKLTSFSDFFDQIIVNLSDDAIDVEQLKFRSFNDKGHRYYETINNLNTIDTEIVFFRLTIKLLRFTQTDNNFNISEELFVRFHSSQYSISSVDLETNVHKGYKEILTLSEQNFIVKNVINGIRLLINTKVKIDE